VLNSRHPAPPPSNFKALIRAVKQRGFTLDISTSRQLSKTLDAASDPDDPFFNKLVRILTTRCMLQAVYFCSGKYPYSEFNHYGLAAPIYTHFTSPIRRYAGILEAVPYYLTHDAALMHGWIGKLAAFVDVIVHRLLAAAIGISSDTAYMNTRVIQRIANGIYSAPVAGCLLFADTLNCTRYQQTSSNGTACIDGFGVIAYVVLFLRNDRHRRCVRHRDHGQCVLGSHTQV
jgi:hypothetical protein